jgi:hypothetical protein
MATGKTAGDGEAKQRPRHWDKMVLAAYLRIMGRTQKEAAEAAGRSERTIQAWEASELWREAEQEAEEDTFLRSLKHASMRAVLQNVEDGNPMLGWDALQRLIPQLAPKQRLEHTGKNGGPIQTETRLAEVPDSELFRGRDDALSKAVGIG